MAKNIDYSKVKAFAQSIIECIGDDLDVGEHPDLPKGDSNDNGSAEDGAVQYETEGKQEPVLDFIGNELGDGKDEEGEAADDDDEPAKRKKRDASIAMMGSVLASKMKK